MLDRFWPGLAMGAVYALIGVTYNTDVLHVAGDELHRRANPRDARRRVRFDVHSAARAAVDRGIFLTLAACALVGVITEIIAVRPVLKSLEQHLYVLSTLALALMIQQVTAIEWSTEPQGFPRLMGSDQASGTKNSGCRWRAVRWS